MKWTPSAMGYDEVQLSLLDILRLLRRRRLEEGACIVRLVLKPKHTRDPNVPFV